MRLHSNGALEWTTYYNESSYSGVTSCPGQFIVSDNLYASVIDLYCMHDGDNLSDHSPVFMQLGVDMEHMSVETTPCRIVARRGHDPLTSI